VIVGVNKYQQSDQEQAVDVLEIDNAAVREEQIEQLKQLRQQRSSQTVKAILAKITAAAKAMMDGCARPEEDNVLALAVEAARERCTVGEISEALEVVFGRYQATSQTVTGVYSRYYQGHEAAESGANRGQGEEVVPSENEADKQERLRWQALTAQLDQFQKQHGRRPRMLVAKMGQDGHDRGAKVIATAFSDMGFDIDLSPLFATPEEIAKQAIENDVHIVGISSQAGGHKTLVPQLIQTLVEQDADDILVIVGGVIPQQDYESLYQAGVKAIFGPGTHIMLSAEAVLKLLMQ